MSELLPKNTSKVIVSPPNMRRPLRSLANSISESMAALYSLQTALSYLRGVPLSRSSKFGVSKSYIGDNWEAMIQWLHETLGYAQDYATQLASIDPLNAPNHLTLLDEAISRAKSFVATGEKLKRGYDSAIGEFQRLLVDGTVLSQNDTNSGTGHGENQTGRTTPESYSQMDGFDFPWEQEITLHPDIVDNFRASDSALKSSQAALHDLIVFWSHHARTLKTVQASNLRASVDGQTDRDEIHVWERNRDVIFDSISSIQASCDALRVPPIPLRRSSRYPPTSKSKDHTSSPPIAQPRQTVETLPAPEKLDVKALQQASLTARQSLLALFSITREQGFKRRGLYIVSKQAFAETGAFGLARHHAKSGFDVATSVISLFHACDPDVARCHSESLENSMAKSMKDIQFMIHVLKDTRLSLFQGLKRSSNAKGAIVNAQASTYNSTSEKKLWHEPLVQAINDLNSLAAEVEVLEKWWSKLWEHRYLFYHSLSSKQNPQKLTNFASDHDYLAWTALQKQYATYRLSISDPRHAFDELTRPKQPLVNRLMNGVARGLVYWGPIRRQSADTKGADYDTTSRASSETLGSSSKAGSGNTGPK
ncbi:hypothetical protein HGRIS_006619 [Hohenbuehelia grisea]|uniref:PH-response regulator protein palC n=1 Tax=Hohenbuehelia grisea TaxID=104357 RepID=A0ABR3J9K2_9AGAR